MASYNRNHTYQDISFNLGETWTLVGTLNINNAPVPVDSDSVVVFKLANSKGLVLNLSFENGTAIVDFSTASYQIVIPVSQQKNTSNLYPGLYRYELSVIFGSEIVSIQAEGSCTLNSSLSYQFKT